MCLFCKFLLEKKNNNQFNVELKYTLLTLTTTLASEFNQLVHQS
jgi:hypothetical protein